MAGFLDRLSALGRGSHQGLSLGWGDELTSALLGALPGPEDPEGMSRVYAAGSPQADYLQTERAANEDAQARYPRNYGTGQLIGAIPTAAATALGGGLLGELGLAGRTALAGLTGGARGAVEGAGHGEEGNRLESAAQYAAPAALMGVASEAAPVVGKAVKDTFKNGPPPSGPLGPMPAMAGAGGAAPVRQAARAETETVNKAVTARPPRRAGRAQAQEAAPEPRYTPEREYGIRPGAAANDDGIEVSIPKPAKTPKEMEAFRNPKGLSEENPSMYHEFDEYAGSADKEYGAKLLAEEEKAQQKALADRQAKEALDREGAVAERMVRDPSTPPYEAAKSGVLPPAGPGATAEGITDNLNRGYGTGFAKDITNEQADEIAVGVGNRKPEYFQPPWYKREAVVDQIEEARKLRNLPPETDEALDQSFLGGFPKHDKLPNRAEIEAPVLAERDFFDARPGLYQKVHGSRVTGPKQSSGVRLSQEVGNDNPTGAPLGDFKFPVDDEIP